MSDWNSPNNVHRQLADERRKEREMTDDDPTRDGRDMGHTRPDAIALRNAGISPDQTAPREQPVRCPMHDQRHPVTTFNLAGRCDDPAHYVPPSIRATGRETCTITITVAA